MAETSLKRGKSVKESGPRIVNRNADGFFDASGGNAPPIPGDDGGLRRGRTVKAGEDGPGHRSKSRHRQDNGLPTPPTASPPPIASRLQRNADGYWETVKTAVHHTPRSSSGNNRDRPSGSDHRRRPSEGNDFRDPDRERGRRMENGSYSRSHSTKRSADETPTLRGAAAAPPPLSSRAPPVSRLANGSAEGLPVRSATVSAKRYVSEDDTSRAEALQSSTTLGRSPRRGGDGPTLAPPPASAVPRSLASTPTVPSTSPSAAGFNFDDMLKDLDTFGGPADSPATLTRTRSPADFSSGSSPSAPKSALSLAAAPPPVSSKAAAPPLSSKATPSPTAYVPAGSAHKKTASTYDKMSEDIDQLLNSSLKTASTANYKETLAARRAAEEVERKAKEDRDRRERERLERERAETRERLENERLEKERVEKEKERAATEKREAEERAERERLDKERVEWERKERERKAMEEQERAELEALERERAEAAEKERLAMEAELLEKDKKEAERRELERKETERQRREAERREAERREADRREAEMVAAERERMMQADRERRMAQAANAEPSGDAPIDESIIVPDFIEGIMQVLQSDQTPTPTPEDFTSSDGYAMWQQTMGMSLQNVLCELLQARYIDGPERRRREEASSRRRRDDPREVKGAGSNTAVKVFFKVVQAKGLLVKDGRTRDPYVRIAYGDNPDPDDEKRKNQSVFNTEVVKGTTNPTFNQHLNITATNLTDKIVVAVYDRLKDGQFLGKIRLSFGELITASAKEGYCGRWYKLEGRGDKKDKYVGGEVLIEFQIDQNDALVPQQTSSSRHSDPGQLLQQQLMNCRISFKSLYITLLRACLSMDQMVLAQQFHPQPIPDATSEILSAETKALLAVLGRLWTVGEAFRVIAYLGLLFEKYKAYEVPTNSLLNAYETLYENMKKKPDWLSSYERPDLVDLLEQMHEYYRTQVTKYKEFYPKNMPRGALETTILMLRMIHKNPIYRDAHPEVPESFREELKGVMTDACIARYHKLAELTSPFDETDTEGVMEGVEKLAEMLSDEIEADNKYFMKPFARELDIVRLTAETYLKYFVLTLENHTETIASDQAVRTASKTVFALYKRLRVMDERYAKLVPGLKRLSVNAGFNVERWFAPFVHKWLEHLGEKTLEWVTNAVKADGFEPVVPPGEGGDNVLHHSSSIADLFSAVYQELDFIADLGWSNPVQNALFLQAFARTVNKAIEQYCDAIALGELKVEQGQGTNWRELLGNKAGLGPKDIGNESCVKLCNIQYAMGKLDDMYALMNVAALSRTIQNHRATMAPPRRTAASSSSASDDGDTVSGAFKIQMLYAENLKPCNKNGLANPYVVVRVPEGTVVPQDTAADQLTAFRLPLLASRTSTATGSSGSSGTLGRRSSSSSGSAPGPTTLAGQSCEMARSRAISDSINPTWDETFQIILPPVSKLEVAVLSKNLLTADEVAGKSTVEFKGKLKRKLGDHQVHDVYVELEPQGRLLLRVTLEGKEEDVDFWFRRSKERLGRLRDDFVRALTSRIHPYVREVIGKALKDQEAAPLPSKGFFSSLTTTAVLSDRTANGVSIEERIGAGEADAALAPLTDYLNKNLATLCQILSMRMAQELIRRIWTEVLAIVDNALVPPLYGPIERDRRVLNRRQVSMAEWTVRIMREFFHADGADLGLPVRVLESRKYGEILSLLEAYLVTDVMKLRREYELGLLAGRDKEYLLKLVRVRTEKGEEDVGKREEGRKWVEQQLVKRKEVSRKN